MSDDRTKINAIEEMRFRLLIDAVVDYAIYMIGPRWHHHQLERWRQAFQRV